MKKSLSIFLAVVLATTVLYFFWARHQPGTSQKRTIVLPPFKKVPAKELATQVRPPLPMEGASDTACTRFWTSLRAQNLESLSRGMPAELPAVGSCKNPPGQLANFQESYDQHCSPASVAHSEGARACFLSLLNYRAQLTEYFTRDVPLNEISDMLTLYDKLAARMEAPAEALLSVAERMLALDPSLYPAAKAQLLARIQLTIEDEENSLRLWDDVESAVKTAKELEKNDPELYEAEAALYLLGRDNPEYVRSLASEMGERFPQSGLGPYYAAWLSAREGNLKKAQNYLQLAIKANSDDDRFAKALQMLREDPDGNPDAAFDLRISFEAQDF